MNHRDGQKHDSSPTTMEGLQSLVATPTTRHPRHDAEPVLEPQIGLDETTRTRVVEAMQRLLADEIALYLKTRNFHWNVEGPNFFQLHTLFQSQYEQIDVVMDDVAERIRAIGGFAAGSMNEYVKLTHIPEITGAMRSDPESRMELLLLRDHELVIRELRMLVDTFNEWGDAGTQDFVTSVMKTHEKMAWMLRSLVGGGR
jgi:starvation-inducible DNA-binding protein